MPTTIRSHIFKKRPISPSNTVQDTFNALEPLYVDLDGTLTPVDTLHEALTEVLRSQPLALPQALRSLLKGKSAFKATTAQLASLDASTLPWMPARCPITSICWNYCVRKSKKAES